jgi:RHS repeat-associated protein
VSTGRLRRVSTRISIVFALPLLLVATFSGAGKVPGERLGPDRLQQDTLNLLLRMDGAAAPECERRTLVKSQVIRPPTVPSTPGSAKPAGAWQERWDLDRCGQIVAWDVRYTPSADGGIDGAGIHIGVGLAPEDEIRDVAGAAGASADHADTGPSEERDKGLAPDAMGRSERPTFLVTSLDDQGPGSLAQAILDANVSPNQDGPDLILFRIADPGPHTITLTAALPAITDPVVIDGESRPRAGPDLAEGNDAMERVQVDGSRLAQPAHGLLLRAGSSTIRGLSIRGFDGDGIRIEQGGSNTIEGNLLGGNAEAGHGPANSGSGIAVVDSSHNVIGGLSPSARNVIGANGQRGVRIAGDASIGNAILGNSILLNGGDGIDLEPESARVGREHGSGPNRLLQPPVFTSALYAPAEPGHDRELVVEGVFEGEATATYRLEAFATSPRGPAPGIERTGREHPESPPSEGERLLTSIDVVAGDDGKAGFQLHLPGGVHSRDSLTATATDRDGNTSEFSQPLASPAFTIMWNTGTGNWGTPGNWSPPQVPGSGDDVLIAENGVNSTFTVTLNVAATVNSLTLGGGSGTQTLSLTSPTLTLNAASSVSANGVLTQTAGTITGAGSLAIDGAYNWSGGVMTGTGTTTVNGPLNLTGTGEKQVTSSRVLTSTGTAQWTGGVLRLLNTSAVINNGVWEAKADAPIAGSQTIGTFTNTGTFRKTSTSGTTTVSVPFANNGTVEVQTGTLNFNGGGFSTGGFLFTAPTTLQFGGSTFNLNAGTTFAGLGTVLLSGGTVNVNDAVSLPAETGFTMTGGFLAGAGTLTVEGACSWPGGEMTGTGVTTINGPLSLTGTSEKRLSQSRVLNNGGTAMWSGGLVRLLNTSVINNLGTWDGTIDGSIIGSLTAGTFVNSGTFVKSAGSGTTNVDIPFTNSGIVDVQSGTVGFTGGGGSTGGFRNSAPTAALQFGGGTFNVNTGTTFEGPGSLMVTGGTLNINNTIAVPSPGEVLVSGGTVNVNAAIASPPATTFTMTGGTLGGTSALTIDGDCNWSGGAMTGTGTTTVNGPLSLTGTGEKQVTSSRVLISTGTAQWTGGVLRLLNTSAVINNGVWEAKADAPIAGSQTIGTFTNTGTFRKTTTSGTTTVSVPFANNGTVEVQTGTLNFNGGGFSTGGFLFAAPTTLQFGGSTFNLNLGTSFAGLGTVLLSGGTVNVNDAISLPAETGFTMTGGFLAGAGTLTVEGACSWPAGEMTGTGITTINGPLGLTGTGEKRLSQSRVLNNGGTATWSGGLVRLLNTSVINNLGTWDDMIDGSIVGSLSVGTFVNSGTFVKSAGSGTTTVGIPFTNSGIVDVRSGTLNVGVSGATYTQTAGITSLTGGAFTSFTNISILGGLLAGTGTVTGPVVVGGTGALAPGFSPGALSLVGDYAQQAPDGSFNVEIGGTTPGLDFDRVDISGAGSAATLAGKLNVSLVNSFTPSPGDSFTIMTYPSHTGTFTPSVPATGCLGWEVSYGATSVDLSTVGVPVEVTGLAFADQVTLVWDPAPMRPGTVYDLLRGEIGHLPVGVGPGEVCTPDIPVPTTTDTDVPAVGRAFWYVVRERIPECGPGTFGHTRDGAERVSSTCPGANTVPTSNAGPDETLPAGSTVQLDGSSSSDPQGTPLNYSWSLTAVPAGSGATLSDAGIVNPTFLADKPGAYVARLVVDDGFLSSPEDTAEITATNRAPIARDDAVSTTQDIPLTIDVLANDNDPDLDPLTVTGVTQPTNGTAEVNQDNTVTYTPGSGFMGTDSFTYAIDDGQGETASATVQVTVNPPEPPCPAPTITSVAPLVGPVGTEVTITGADLGCGSTRTLALNGMPAVITFVSATVLKTFIPIGGQDGLFACTTAGGTAISPPQFAFDVVTSSDFTLTIAPTDGQVIQGSSSSYSVQIDNVGGEPFTGLAQLELNGVPSGVQATLSPATLTGGQRGRLTVTAASDAPIGAGELTLNATASIDAQVVNKSVTFDLTILEGNRTSLLGQFVLKGGQPMPGVVLKLISHVDGSELAETTTDDGGNFVFLDPPAGVLTLSVDTTPFDPSRPYPMYGVDVTLVAGQATVVGPFTVTPPPPPSAFVPISNAAQDQVVTNPAVPGISITLPAGATVTGWDGLVKDKITIVPLSPDELPMPHPPGPTRSLYQFNFGTSMGGIPSVPLPVTLPNDQGADPGEKVDIWYYDAAPLVGAEGIWRLAGPGTVSQDGRVIVSDPGVGIERFCGVCGTVCLIRRQLAQLLRNPLCEDAADPVDLFLGQQIEERTDLVLPGRIPAVIHRTYNPEDPFAIKGLTLGLGPGWAFSVDVVLLQASPMLQRVILPGNARSDFAQQGPGTFINSDNLLFMGAVLTASGDNTFHLRFKDGTVWRFVPHPNPLLAGTYLLSAQTDRNGNVLTIDRDSAGNITRLIEPAGRSLSFTYGGGRITRITDPLGRSVHYGYASGRLQTVTDPANGVTTYTYDSSGRILTITDPRGILYLTNTYNLEGRLTSQTQADGTAWTFEYLRPVGATSGAVVATRATDPRGNSTLHRFAPNGLTNESIDALGQRTRYERDFRGQVMSITDPLDHVTRFEYDGAGNPTSITDAAGHIQRFEYESEHSKPTRIIDPLGNTTALEYDPHGNLVAVVDPEQYLKPPSEQLKTTITYDTFGQPMSSTDALGHTVHFSYDSSGNLVSISDPLGNTTLRTYDAISRLTSEIDPRGRATTFDYDDLGRLINSTDRAGASVAFQYDKNGNVLSVMDPRGNTLTQSFDSMDRLASRHDQLGLLETFIYDSNGNLTHFDDRSQQPTSYEYDTLNRRISETYADGSATQYHFDAGGRLVRVTDSASGTALFTYDDVDQLLGVTDPSQTIAYNYDSARRRAGTTSSSVPSLLYTYDSNSRLRQVTQAGSLVSIDYDALGRRTLLTLPNGVKSQYAYDALSRVAQLTYQNSTGSLGSLTYSYDSAGNPAGVSGTLARTLLPAPVPSATYDASNRQTSFDNDQMLYDPTGNLIHLSSQAGNTTYSWDARGRLIGIVGPGVTASFTYDMLGRRSSRDINGQALQYLYDSHNMSLETTGATSHSYLSGPSLDERWSLDNESYYLSDALGSTIALTDVFGDLTTLYEYEPFGIASEIGSPSTNRFQFTSRENDGTGLYYYRARYYSPTLRRFISEDPFPDSSLSANRFAYVGNRPTVRSDPLGLIDVIPFTYTSRTLPAAPDSLLTFFGGGGSLILAHRETADLLHSVSISKWEGYGNEAVGVALNFLPAVNSARAGMHQRFRYDLVKAISLSVFTIAAGRAGCKGPCNYVAGHLYDQSFEAVTDVIGYNIYVAWDTYENAIALVPRGIYYAGRAYEITRGKIMTSLSELLKSQGRR